MNYHPITPNHSRSPEQQVPSALARRIAVVQRAPDIAEAAVRSMLQQEAAITQLPAQMVSQELARNALDAIAAAPELDIAELSRYAKAVAPEGAEYGDYQKAA